jgi:nodulation protein A
VSVEHGEWAFEHGSDTMDLDWTSVWEDDVVDHASLAVSWRRRSRTRSIGGEQSWSSARPELRLVGRADGQVVSRTPPSSGGSCRSTGRRAARRRRRAGRGRPGAPRHRPRRRTLGAGPGALCELGVPFGFLTCGEQVAGLLRARRLGRVPGPTRMIRADGRTQVYGGVSMVLALATPLDAWPSGRIDRNGWEV